MAGQSYNDSVAYDMENRTGGHMMFIPDSIAKGVQSVIDGYSVIVRNDSKIDPAEKIIVNGDTVPLIIKERNFGRFSRGLYNYIFVPKGTWHFGLTASYGEFNADDVQLLDLISDFDFYGHTVSIKPAVSYFISNNMSIGLRFVYTSSKGELGSFAMDFDEDLNFNISDVMYRDESYSAAATFNHYIGLSRNGRFGVFNEVELRFASGNGDFCRNYDGVPKNTRTTYMETSLNFSPGVSIFLMKNVAFNVSFGVFGLHLRKEKQFIDGIFSGDRLTSGANFRFNIFNINFGIGVFI